MIKCDSCYRVISGTVKYKTMYGYIWLCPKCKWMWETYYPKKYLKEDDE